MATKKVYSLDHDSLRQPLTTYGHDTTRLRQQKPVPLHPTQATTSATTRRPNMKNCRYTKKILLETRCILYNWWIYKIKLNIFLLSNGPPDGEWSPLRIDVCNIKALNTSSYLRDGFLSKRRRKEKNTWKEKLCHRNTHTPVSYDCMKSHRTNRPNRLNHEMVLAWILITTVNRILCGSLAIKNNFAITLSPKDFIF